MRQLVPQPQSDTGLAEIATWFNTSLLTRKRLSYLGRSLGLLYLGLNQNVSALRSSVDGTCFLATRNVILTAWSRRNWDITLLCEYRSVHTPPETAPAISKPDIGPCMPARAMFFFALATWQSTTSMHSTLNFPFSAISRRWRSLGRLL